MEIKMSDYNPKELIYVIPKGSHDEEKIKKILGQHPEIKFVSMIGVDLSGNDTDEKIPIKVFSDDIKTFLEGSTQTDGSSVVLTGIATLNNAKVDMHADSDVNWYIDYNYENIDKETGKPIGTLRIPCFLLHENQYVDSRHVLKRSVDFLKTFLMEKFKQYPEILKKMGIKYEDIEDITATSGTELEFWVKTPDKNADIEELSTSQVLQEQYWTRTMGSVRTALEESLLTMDYYGLNPEMGHKEVGGVQAKLDNAGNLTHIMEQLEIDWKYSDALQAADNENLVRMIVKETFRKNGLDVTFNAKPIEGVAGSGEHTHIGISMKLKNNKKLNLFAGPKNHYMSIFGYAAIMGILKNYEIINPMISNTNDSLRRLKPGFEAPICIVTSLGHSVELPSRNRTVLIGLVRDIENPLSTRFELRSPNPHTNSYLAIAALYSAIIDGINYAIQKNKTEDELLKELSKKYGEESEYLEKFREYRTEEDVFEDFNETDRAEYFGKSPATVYENVQAFDVFPEKVKILENGNVFNSKIINSFKTASISRWAFQIERRIIVNYLDELRSFKMLHTPDKASDLDISNWSAIVNLVYCLMKDSHSSKSLITRIKENIQYGSFKEVSKLQIELDSKMNEVRELYAAYKRNIIMI
jgi:glutamine synthetase